jgi:hypothetical protein
VGAILLALLLGPIRAQHTAELDAYWVSYLPDWSRPWAVPWWAVQTTTGVFRYCLKPHGEGPLVLALLGVLALWRGGRRGAVLALSAPLGLALAAGLLGRYPYTSTRLMVFAAPAVCLLAAAGAGWALDGLRSLARPACLLVLGVLLLPAGQAAQSVVRPWSAPDVPGAVERLSALRRPDDPIFTQSCVCRYYLRHLGPRLVRGPVAGRPSEGERRVWVVWVEETSAPQRRDRARGVAPPGWRWAEGSDLRFVTVALFERPEASPRRH